MLCSSVSNLIEHSKSMNELQDLQDALLVHWSRAAVNLHHEACCVHIAEDILTCVLHGHGCMFLI